MTDIYKSECISAVIEHLKSCLQDEKEQMLIGNKNSYGFLSMILNDIGIYEN